MGYGHQRAILPLLPIAAHGEVLTANNYEGMPVSDRASWRRIERLYNFVSRRRGKGPLGALAFAAFDRFQRVEPFYPRRNQSEPTLQLTWLIRKIRSGWGRHLIEQLRKEPLPLVTTYFTVAHMAEAWDYPEPVFVIVTDSDIPRVWAPIDPASSNIAYFVPTERAAERLLQYGVKKESVHTTGFPLPQELIGSGDSIAKRLLKERLLRLDPRGVYRAAARGLIVTHCGTLPRGPKRIPLALTFAIGGAGAQTEIAENLTGLAPFLRSGAIELYLSAGISRVAAERFRSSVRRAGCEALLGKTIRIVLTDTKEAHFSAFNEVLAKTDVLWTKPSELSFYAALGIPLLLAPPLGSHEEKNREWLLELGAGIDQGDPRLVGKWLPDILASGRFAEAALNGFIKIDRQGAERITRIVVGPVRRGT